MQPSFCSSCRSCSSCLTPLLLLSAPSAPSAVNPPLPSYPSTLSLGLFRTLENSVSRLRVFEATAERGVVAVGEAQELDRVESPLGGPLLHLNPAGAALGGTKFDV